MGNQCLTFMQHFAVCSWYVSGPPFPSPGILCDNYGSSSLFDLGGNKFPLRSISLHLAQGPWGPSSLTWSVPATARKWATASVITCWKLRASSLSTVSSSQPQRPLFPWQQPAAGLKVNWIEPNHLCSFPFTMLCCSLGARDPWLKEVFKEMEFVLFSFKMCQKSETELSDSGLGP